MAKSEEVEIEETEDKARDIGKQMGAVKEKKPEADDEEEFEIEVVDEDDKKLAKNSERQETEAETKRAEREKLSNREKRHLRNRKRDEKFAAKDAIIQEQATKLAALERKQAEQDGRLHGINKAEVERAFNEAQQHFRNAEADYLAGEQEGDGARKLRAMQTMKESDDRMKLLKDTYSRLNNQAPKQQEQHEQQQKHDPRVVNQTKKWMDKNDWYDPSGSDEESAIAIALAGVLVKEGMDPKDKDYWEELDERLEERLNKKAKVEDDDEEFEDEEEEEVRPKKRRAAPPVNGSTKRSDSINGKKTMRVPTAYVEKMKREVPEIWNDPVRKKRLLENRERIIKENS